jgi:hypothetical protein
MFPAELTTYSQWVCWRYATVDDKVTKLPINPITGIKADVTDCTTWSDYQTACNAAKTNSTCIDGIGFVLTENDPYICVDLDPTEDPVLKQKQIEIFNTLNSYSEVSPSGKGLHIFIKVRDRLPGNCRFKKIEIYSSIRYMTMTGNTYHDVPIIERQTEIEQLWAELNSNRSLQTSIIVDEPERYSDERIFETARQAENGDKFYKLWTGNYQEFYSSHSEADLALINILSFYSRNMAQIRRMFILSALGKRKKASRVNNYIDPMIKKSFDNQVPLIPLEAIKMSVVNDLARKDGDKDAMAAIVETKDDHQWTRPPGLMGEIADFVYASAPRPVREVALGAAIGLMAGICGRAYNVSGTGLNQYVLVIAKTGTGKEAAQTGINKLMQAVKQTVPAAGEFIGPAEIASGQALIKYLDKHPCFVSVVGEFGLMLQQICSPMATAPQAALQRTMLSLYNMSGFGQLLQPTIYSDKANNTQIVKSPAFTLLGESTPETFYVALDEHMISKGLMPRFTCIEYLGNRPKLNEKHRSVEPTNELILKIRELCNNALVLSEHSKVININLTPDAEKLAKEFNEKCDSRINGTDIEISKQLWNRAHIKALKLAALIAIGCNPYVPVIEADHFAWAEHLVSRDILNVLRQFDMGKAGKDTSEINQINEVVHYISDYLKKPFEAFRTYQSVTPQMHSDKVIPVSYLQRRVLNKNSFKNDRYGGIAALKRTLDNLVSDGSIREFRQMDMQERYKTTMKAFLVIDQRRFDTQSS